MHHGITLNLKKGGNILRLAFDVLKNNYRLMTSRFVTLTLSISTATR
jgi:hypothetical protein